MAIVVWVVVISAVSGIVALSREKTTTNLGRVSRKILEANVLFLLCVFLYGKAENRHLNSYYDFDPVFNQQWSEDRQKDNEIKLRMSKSVVDAGNFQYEIDEMHNPWRKRRSMLLYLVLLPALYYGFGRGLTGAWIQTGEFSVGSGRERSDIKPGGIGSTRKAQARWEQEFTEWYHLCPETVRKLIAQGQESGGGMMLMLYMRATEAESVRALHNEDGAPIYDFRKFVGLFLRGVGLSMVNEGGKSTPLMTAQTEVAKQDLENTPPRLDLRDALGDGMPKEPRGFVTRDDTGQVVLCDWNEQRRLICKGPPEAIEIQDANSGRIYALCSLPKQIVAFASTKDLAGEFGFELVLLAYLVIDADQKSHRLI